MIEEWEYDIEIREAIQLAISLRESLSRVRPDSFPDSAAETLRQDGR